MLLKRLRMKNFFRYYDDQSIEFVHDAKKNVTVIRGENGWGKTTLLGAFLWCFYGVLEKPLVLEKMYNKKARTQLNEGDVDTVFVEIDFLDKDVVYSIRREQPFKMHEGNMLPAGAQKIVVKFIDPVGNSKDVDVDGRTFFNRIIPEDLKQFFFFDGEKINRLAQEDGREEIREAILNLLGLSVLENLKSDLETVDQKLNRELKKYLQGKDADLAEKKNECISLKHEYEQKQKELISRRKVIDAEVDSISNWLLAFNSTIVTTLETERNQIDQDIVSIKKDYETLGKRVNQHISTNAKNMLIFPYLQHIFKILEEKRIKGELPSDIKETFISDLLNKGVCICGTKIEMGSDEEHLLNQLKKTAGKRELDDAYIRIISFINANESFEKTFFKDYGSLILEEQEKIKEKTRKSERIKEIDDILAQSDVEEIARKTEYRKVLEKKLINIGTDIKSTEKQIDELVKKIADVEKELENAEIQNSEAKKIKNQINMVRELAKLNKTIQETFKDDVRQDLDARIKKVFKSISHKGYREPVLTENLKLKVVNTFSENMEEEILSTGESQVSSLSFIGALVSYSRDKQHAELVSNFMGGDFPIVMDSPFGNLDSVHSAQIAKGIGDLSNQVVIIVSKKQWANEVENNIYHRMGKMYELVEGFVGDEKMGEYTEIRELRI